MAGYNRVLIQSFEGALGQVQRKVVLSHSQRVTRLYRQSLRTLNSWVIDRAIFCREARKIRAQFDTYKDLSPESGVVKRVISEGEAEVFKYTHPDPYVVPYMPGGSKFMRNPPPPLDVVFPQGVPPEAANVVPANVYGVQVPVSATPEGMDTVLIDIYKKTTSDDVSYE